MYTDIVFMLAYVFLKGCGSCPSSSHYTCMFVVVLLLFNAHVGVVRLRVCVRVCLHVCVCLYGCLCVSCVPVSVFFTPFTLPLSIAGPVCLSLFLFHSRRTH